MKQGTNDTQSVRLMFGGDVMLGRLVKTYLARYGSAYPLGPVADLMRSADLTIVNLECAITTSESWWSGEPKAFYFGAPPEAIATLKGAGVDIVSLANNHILDFDVEGLRQTLRRLRQAGIRFAGAGQNFREACTPALFTCHDITFGMAAFCDHQQDFAANQNRPGIAYIDLDDEAGALAILRDALTPLQAEGVDWPILSLHWGPNRVDRPSKKFQRLAHAAIACGWKLLFGHSAHVFHGVEIFQACPILYAAGDLVDDYYVDPEWKNDHQLLFEIELDRTTVRRIRLHPVFISNCQTKLAVGPQFDTITAQMTQRCEALGSIVHRDLAGLWVE